MNGRRRWMIVLAIAGSIFILDQGTKWAANQTLLPEMRAGKAPIAFPQSWHPNDIFHLRYARNKGAFLSLGSRLPEHLRVWVLVGVNAVILAILAVVLLWKKDLSAYLIVALALIFGGGAGNLLDRIFREGHEVVDFMNMGVGGLRTGVFNIADLAIMAGPIMILLGEFLPQKDASKETDSSPLPKK
jgi:signal peptidase II